MTTVFLAEGHFMLNQFGVSGTKPFWIATIALISMLAGCEIIAAVDRSLLDQNNGTGVTTSASTGGGNGGATSASSSSSDSTSTSVTTTSTSSSSSVGGGGSGGEGGMMTVSSSSSVGGGGAGGMMGSTTSSVTTTSATTTSTSSAGGGGSGGGCNANEKDCNGNCVSLDDPAFGCDDPACTPCSFANATATCTAGACAIAACANGFDDCDGLDATGCEKNLQTDPANCGTCNHVCSSNACQVGICNPLCGPDNKIVSTIGISLCWILPNAQHPGGKFLGIGGIVDQPNDPDTNVKPFPGCVAPSATDAEVTCGLGDLESLTDLQLAPYLYNDAGGASFYSYACDQPGFPTSDCPGTYIIYNDGVLISSFQDDNVAATPPPAPWSYVDAGFLELAYTNLP